MFSLLGLHVFPCFPSWGFMFCYWTFTGSTCRFWESPKLASHQEAMSLFISLLTFFKVPLTNHGQGPKLVSHLKPMSSPQRFKRLG